MATRSYQCLWKYDRNNQKEHLKRSLVFLCKPLLDYLVKNKGGLKDLEKYGN